MARQTMIAAIVTTSFSEKNYNLWITLGFPVEYEQGFNVRGSGEKIEELGMNNLVVFGQKRQIAGLAGDIAGEVNNTSWLDFK